MDGSTKTFEVDPAVTCAELCQLIKNKLGLRDIFGFSIFIEALNQVRLIFENRQRHNTSITSISMTNVEVYDSVREHDFHRSFAISPVINATHCGYKLKYVSPEVRSGI